MQLGQVVDYIGARMTTVRLRTDSLFFCRPQKTLPGKFQIESQSALWLICKAWRVFAMALLSPCVISRQ